MTVHISSQNFRIKLALHITLVLSSPKKDFPEAATNGRFHFVLSGRENEFRLDVEFFIVLPSLFH